MLIQAHSRPRPNTSRGTACGNMTTYSASAAARHARAVDDPGQHADHRHADGGDRDAQDQAVGEGGPDRAHLQRGFVVGQRELHLRQDHGGEAFERGQQQRGERQDHRDDDVAPGDAEQRPAHAPTSIGRGRNALPVMVA